MPKAFATQIPDGAGRLSTEGTKELIKAGQGTASDYGKKYAVIEAGAARAKAEGMAYGAPAGAAGFTAYSLELAGMDGQGAQSTGRLFTGVAAFGAAAGLALWRRRSLALSLIHI